MRTKRRRPISLAVYILPFPISLPDETVSESHVVVEPTSRSTRMSIERERPPVSFSRFNCNFLDVSPVFSRSDLVVESVSVYRLGFFSSQLPHTAEASTCGIKGKVNDINYSL